VSRDTVLEESTGVPTITTRTVLGEDEASNGSSTYIPQECSLTRLADVQEIIAAQLG